MMLYSLKSLALIAILVVILGLLQKIRQKKPFIKNIQLLIIAVCSIFFLFTYSWKFCICVFAITLIVYVVSIRIDSTRSLKWLCGGGHYSNWFSYTV